MTNLFKKLCKKVVFTQEKMGETLKQSFLTIDNSMPNYWLCICERKDLINYLNGDNIIRADCRLFVHLSSLVLTGDNVIIFQMPKKLGGIELLIPDNISYLYLNTPYRYALESVQGQFLIKHSNKYYGLVADPQGRGVKSMKMNQWKKWYMNRIKEKCRAKSNELSSQNLKLGLIYCKLMLGEIKIRVISNWGGIVKKPKVFVGKRKYARVEKYKQNKRQYISRKNYRNNFESRRLRY